MRIQDMKLRTIGSSILCKDRRIASIDHGRLTGGTVRDYRQACRVAQKLCDAFNNTQTK